MDPITLLSTASMAFNGLKQLVANGRELTDCLQQINQWCAAVSDLDKVDELLKKKKSSLFRSLIPQEGKSIQEQAMEAYTAKLKVRKQREELRQMIQYSQGEHGWHEFLRMEKQAREERQKLIYAEIERKEKLKDIAVATGVVFLAIATLGIAIWLMVAVREAN